MIHNYTYKITLLLCDYKNMKGNVLFMVTGITWGASRPSFSLGGGRSSGDGGGGGDGDGVRIMLECRRGVDGRGRGGGRGGGGVGQHLVMLVHLRYPLNATFCASFYCFLVCRITKRSYWSLME